MVALLSKWSSLNHRRPYFLIQHSIFNIQVEYSPVWVFQSIGCNFVSNFQEMKKWFLSLLMVVSFSLFFTQPIDAQCSICTRTAQQLGEGPAKGMNGGILYLAFMPMAIVGVIGWRWWRNNRQAASKA
jgi:hypothetical protein